jgi:hypothetical protein
MSGSTLTGLAGGGGALAAGASTGLTLAALAMVFPPAIRHVLQSQGITRAMIAEALHRGANPGRLRRALINAARDARFTVPAAQAVSENKGNK